MELPTKIQFADEKVKKAFEELKDSDNKEQELYKNLVKAFDDISNNAFGGIQIPKRQIPVHYIKVYKIHNLWKYNLPHAWRLLYSIENKEIVVVSIILEWLDHKEYERRFKY